MCLMLSQESAGDYGVASGVGRGVRDIAYATFSSVGLDGGKLVFPNFLPQLVLEGKACG
jgi:GDP-D-mannose dehydratase